MKRGPRYIEYPIGSKINGVTYLGDDDPFISPTNGKAYRIGKFICPHCNSQFSSRVTNVKIGKTKSCGCASPKLGGRTKHGMYGTPIYRIYNSIKYRCRNKRDKAYKYYGARGINISDLWYNDFTQFYNHVSKLPNFGEAGYWLDRIDNNGNYEPGNLRWATCHVQLANRGKNTNNTSGYTGVNMSKKKWASRIMINYKTIRIGLFSTKSDAVDARNKYIIDNELTEYKIQEYESC